jgi:hypothetical protein
MFETAGKIKFQANLKSKVDRVNTHGKVVYIYIKSEFSVIYLTILDSKHIPITIQSYFSDILK